MTRCFNKFNYKSALHVLLLLIATMVIGAYFLSENLIDFSSVNQEIMLYRSILQIATIISFIVLSFYISHDISKIFLLKLGTSYFIYWNVSYVLLKTQNINNEAFSVWHFIENKYFEIDSWWMILGIISLATTLNLLFRYSNSFTRFNGFFKDYSKSNLSLAFLVSLIVVQDSKLLANLKQFLYLSNSEEALSFLTDLMYKLPLIVMTITLAAYTFWYAFEGVRKNKSTLSLAIISSFAFAILFNYTIQDVIKSDIDYLGLFVFPGATLFQIMMLVLIYMMVYFIFNRYWLASLFIMFSGIAVTVANGIKMNMRSEPLLLTDFSMITQLDLIFSFLDTKVLVFSLVLIVILTASYFFLKKKFLKGKIFDSVWKRVVLTISVLSVLGGIFTIFFRQKDGAIPEHIPVLSRLNNERNIAFEGHARSAQYQSLMFVWVKQLTKPIMEKPEEYSQEAISDLVTKYQKRADEINETRTQNINDETVIFILSESLSEPTRIDGVTLTKNVLSNIDEISSQTTSGLMQSDAYGGGTANIEIQTLLGLPFYNLSSSVAIYNVEVVPKMTTLPSISDSFKPENRLVIHLGETKLYSRADVYRRLKFDSFIANDENAIKPTESVNYGGYPSDASTYQNILDNLSIDESQFFSVITYQNHVPWSMSEPAEISGTGEGFTEKENERLSHYARLLNETDIVTKDFLDSLSKMDKEITVVFYGDHLPGLYPQSAFTSDPESQYLTDYFIWSNKNNQKKNYPMLNSSDFPAAVLAHTNSRVSPYYALLTDVLENASVDKENLMGEQQEIADDLKLIQYDLISGKNYLKNFDEFFKMP